MFYIVFFCVFENQLHYSFSKELLLVRNETSPAHSPWRPRGDHLWSQKKYCLVVQPSVEKILQYSNWRSSPIFRMKINIWNHHLGPSDVINYYWNLVFQSRGTQIGSRISLFQNIENLPKGPKKQFLPETEQQTMHSLKLYSKPPCKSPVGREWCAFGDLLQHPKCTRVRPCFLVVLGHMGHILGIEPHWKPRPNSSLAWLSEVHTIVLDEGPIGAKLKRCAFSGLLKHCKCTHAVHAQEVCSPQKIIDKSSFMSQFKIKPLHSVLPKLRPHTLAIHPFAHFSAVDIAKAYNIPHSTDRSLCETVTGRPLQHNETKTLTNSWVTFHMQRWFFTISGHQCICYTPGHQHICL